MEECKIRRERNGVGNLDCRGKKAMTRNGDNQGWVRLKADKKRGRKKASLQSDSRLFVSVFICLKRLIFFDYIESIEHSLFEGICLSFAKNYFILD